MAVRLQVYPDSGVAVMLANQWKDAPFRITSLGDRNPIDDDDEIIILAAPDPQGATIASALMRILSCRLYTRAGL